MDQVGNEIKKIAKKIGKFLWKFYKWKTLIVLLMVVFLILIIFTWWDGIKVSAESSSTSAKAIQRNVYTEGNTIKINPNLYEEMRQEMTNEGLKPESLYIDEENDYLEKMVQAELVTNYTVDFKIEGTERTGIIEVRRKLLDQTDIKLEYLTYADFQTKIVNKDDNIKNYYTIDSSSNIVIARVNIITTTDANGAVTESKEYIEESMPYKTLVSQYTMPFEYLYILMETTMNPEYVSAVADLALEQSNIVFTIFDSVTKTTTVTEEEYKNKTEITRTTLPANTTEKSSFEDEELTRELIQTVVEEINTITSGITKVDTWLYKKNVDYTYKQELPREIKADAKQNPGETSEEKPTPMPQTGTYNERILSAANWLTQTLRANSFIYNSLTECDEPQHPMINDDGTLTDKAIYISGAYRISCAAFVTETLYHAGIIESGPIIWATFGTRDKIIEIMKEQRFASRGITVEEVDPQNAQPGDILHYNAPDGATCHICILTEINSTEFKKTGSPEFIYPGGSGGEFAEINGISELSKWIILRVTDVTNRE